jgi:hypothetical protein
MAHPRCTGSDGPAAWTEPCRERAGLPTDVEDPLVAVGFQHDEIDVAEGYAGQAGHGGISDIREDGDFGTRSWIVGESFAIRERASNRASAPENDDVGPDRSVEKEQSAEEGRQDARPEPRPHGLLSNQGLAVMKIARRRERSTVPPRPGRRTEGAQAPSAGDAASVDGGGRHRAATPSRAQGPSKLEAAVEIPLTVAMAGLKTNLTIAPANVIAPTSAKARSHISVALRRGARCGVSTTT